MGRRFVASEKRREESGGFRKTTNNRMELFAAIRGLELLKEPCEVRLYSDSNYLVAAMTQGWARAWKAKGWRRKNEPVPNSDLWTRLLALCDRHKVEFAWVRGHAGNVENECCDRLSSVALKMAHLPVDEGYEKRLEAANTAAEKTPSLL